MEVWGLRVSAADEERWGIGCWWRVGCTNASCIDVDEVMAARTALSRIWRFRVCSTRNLGRNCKDITNGQLNWRIHDLFADLSSADGLGMIRNKMVLLLGRSWSIRHGNDRPSNDEKYFHSTLVLHQREFLTIENDIPPLLEGDTLRTQRLFEHSAGVVWSIFATKVLWNFEFFKLKATKFDV